MVQQRPNQAPSAEHNPELQMFLILQRIQFGSHRHWHNHALMQAAALL